MMTRKAFTIAILFVCGAGCGDDIGGHYVGSGTLSIRAGSPGGTGTSIRQSADITQTGTEISVRTNTCTLPFRITDDGLATVVVGSECVIDPEVDGGMRFEITSGGATFGDGTFGYQVEGRGEEGALELTFAGQKP